MESDYGSRFESELRPSLYWVCAFLASLGLVLVVAAETNSAGANRFALRALGLLLFLVPVATWALKRWQPLAARWVIILGPGAITILGSNWLGTPAALVLLGVPVTLAAALSGMFSAAAVTVGETALLLALPGRAPWTTDSSVIGIALVAIWTALAASALTYLPMYQLRAWLWNHFEKAQAVLEETRERRAEMGQALDDLANAYRQLSLANERAGVLRLIAEEAERTKSMFVAKVSHEFRTPLNMIIGLVSLMVESPEIYAVALPPEMKEDLHIVHRNSQHLASMINDVLDLTQMEVGRLVLHKERVNVAEIVESAVDTVRPLADKKQLALEVALPQDLPPVDCDGTRVRQVILNLLSNAARFTDEGGITVSVTGRDDLVVVSVADTGPGIPPQDAERIFEPFSQGSTDLWRDTGGSGLGLSISRQFVRLHGGRMWLESKLGVGTTFSFELPVSDPVAHSAAPDRWIRGDWVWREQAFRTDRAGLAQQPVRSRLVVFDETGGLYPELARYSDEVELVEVNAIAEAAEELRRSPAHAVLINLGDQSLLGPAIERIKGEASSTPIIGSSVPRPAGRVLGAGAQGYLVKPVTRGDLESAIQSAGRPVRRVLLVDDDQEVLRLFTRMLHVSDSTLTVLSATTGAQALAEIRRQAPDLVLLDVMMPDMNGWQVMEQMGGDETLADVPVVLLSAQDIVDRPAVSESLVATISGGLSISKLLRCSLELSALLLKPETGVHPAPV